MKIKLINLPQPNSLDDKLDPPLGLMYVNSFLKKENINSEILDLPFVPRNEWKKALGSVDICGITVYSSSLYLAKEVARIAKENNPNSKVVLGGPHPTTLPEETLLCDYNFDIVVMQEGELTMLELAQGKELSQISGIAYRKEGKIYKNKQRPLVADLDTLPFPDRGIFKKNNYTRKVYGGRATSLITSRGCPFNCAFCCKDIFGSKVRFRKVESVIAEIKEIIDIYGIRNFLLYDDTFVTNRKRLYALCEELVKLKVIFRCNGNSRHNTYEDYQMLYKAGCREIAFGIESGSQKILNIIDKGTTVEQNKKAIAEARRAGLLVKAYLMVGSPGETKETVAETMKFISESDPDQYTLFNFVPLPGCDIWKRPKHYKIKIVNDDFKEFFNIAGHNEGGLVVETEELKAQDIKMLRERLIEFLQAKGQRGSLQDYYVKVK
jgi:anaerobic magnesium-protoporphyrin IX monomethyl ester cyclase